MIKVLHVTNAYPYPEVPEYGVFVKEQIDAISDAGVQSELVFINGRGKGKRAYLEALAQIRQAARSADLIHCHHLYSGLATAVAMTGKPVVLSFLNDWLHEMDEVKSMTVRRLVCNAGARLAMRVIFKSPIPPQFAGDPKFVYLPNGANSAQFHITDKAAAKEALGLDPAKRHALFVSSKDQYRKQKRYDRFRETMDLLAETAPELALEELVMVNQSRERVLDFFNAADLHLMTSDYEGSPNSVKEALCCGLAVVTTRVGNVDDLLSDVPGCRVAQGFGASELAALVREALAEDAPRETVRAGFLAKDFGQGSVTTRLVALYETLKRG